nr:uncharacterized protein LOC127324972 [Lolium perenne]
MVSPPPLRRHRRPPHLHQGFRKFASPSSTHQRDFMPYIRRAAERKLLQPQVLWMSLLCKAEAECLLDVPSSLLCEDYACWMLRIPEAEHGAADSAALAGEGGTIPVPHFSTQLHQARILRRHC